MATMGIHYHGQRDNGTHGDSHMNQTAIDIAISEREEVIDIDETCRLLSLPPKSESQQHKEAP